MASPASSPSLFDLASDPGSRGKRPGGRPHRARWRRWLGRLSALLALASIALFVWQLERRVEAGRYAMIETGRVRFDAGPGWVDPRWELELAWRIGAHGDVAADDRAAVEAVAADVAELSFVRAVTEASVIWPDGLRLAVELREPVACVRVGRQYAPVAADGTVLSGRWSAPPGRGRGYLPVIVTQRPVRPVAGEVPREIAEERALWDGLAVATSLWDELGSDDLARLGRIVIDARRADRTSVEEPGTVLLLEHARVVWFGRSPNMDEPGETPARLKWASLAKALTLLDDTMDWELADVRWDRPSLKPRGGEAPVQTGM